MQKLEIIAGDPCVLLSLSAAYAAINSDQLQFATLNDFRTCRSKKKREIETVTLSEQLCVLAFCFVVSFFFHLVCFHGLTHLLSKKRRMVVRQRTVNVRVND